MQQINMDVCLKPLHSTGQCAVPRLLRRAGATFDSRMIKEPCGKLRSFSMASSAWRVYGHSSEAMPKYPCCRTTRCCCCTGLWHGLVMTSA